MSTPSPANRAEDILGAALDLDPSAREAFISGACAGNPVLLAEVRTLLATHEAMPPGFLAQPAVERIAAGEIDLTIRSVPVATPPLHAAERAGEMIGHYKLREQIGEGGFGTVWVADQEQPVRRRVALKIIKLGMDTKEVIARFEQERQALAMMDHPNIARVLDAGVTQTGRPYFVMELVRGVKITDYCDDKGLSTGERIDLFIHVCQAVQHAHQKGIIHRDLKPSNILVTINDGVAVPKVIDFGVAKATQGRLTDGTIYTQFQQMIGTPLYMSPEQAEMTSLDVDTRSDIYALGVLLYELLTGRTPIDNTTMAKAGMDEIRRLIREVDPPKPSARLKTLAGDELTSMAKRRHTDAAKLPGALRGDLDWIVMKCIEKDRARRYDTANGLALDLQRHLKNEVVIARPPTTAYLLSKLIRRNKLAFAAGAAIAASLVIGIAASVWQAVRATRAEREQSQLREVAVKALDGEKEQRAHAESEQHRADAQARKASESQEKSRQFLYAADMSLAQQSLKQNNLGKARRLLERHIPQSGEEDLRGWEWRYLWQLTRSRALATLAHRPVRGESVSFSPDGSVLAVGWRGGRVDLWDVPGRRQIRVLNDGEYTYSAHVAFAPTGKLLAATSVPNTVALHDLETGRESVLWRVPDPGEWTVRNLSFSPDGSKVVVVAEPPVMDDPANQISGAVWVVNVASARVESRHATGPAAGDARISADNRRLFMSHCDDAAKATYHIQCIDLGSDKELWRTEEQADVTLSSLALSPDDRALASCSLRNDPAIRIWDAATGRLVARLDGHTTRVSKLAFSADGRRLISAGTDQSIRIWGTATWTETQVLRGHTDEVQTVALSGPSQLIASASKNGDLLLWRDEASRAADGYRFLPEQIGYEQLLPLDHSRVLLLPPGKPPEILDLKKDQPAVPLTGIGVSSNILACFSGKILCHWDGADQILIRELHGTEFSELGRIPLASPERPAGFHYRSTAQFVAWTQASSPASVYCASLAAPGQRMELPNDLPKVHFFMFGNDGKHLAASTKRWDSLRVWNLETGKVVVSINESLGEFTFASGGRVLVATIDRSTDDHEIRFYDLDHPEVAPRLARGKHASVWVASSPDGKMVVASTYGGLLRLFEPLTGREIAAIHAHANSAADVSFSADGSRLLSSRGGQDMLKIWDLRTRQELLNLSGSGFQIAIKWSADGNVIMAGEWDDGIPWQAWSAPSWEEIAAADAKEKAEGKPR